MKIGVIVWNDAHRTRTEVEEYELDHKPYCFTTVGLIIRSDEKGVSIAQEIGEDGRYRDITFIPRLMIVDEWPPVEIRRKKWQKSKPEPSADSPNVEVSPTKPPKISND